MIQQTEATHVTEFSDLREKCISLLWKFLNDKVIMKIEIKYEFSSIFGLELVENFVLKHFLQKQGELKIKQISWNATRKLVFSPV